MIDKKKRYFWIYEKNEKGKLKYVQGSWKALFKFNLSTFLMIVLIVSALLYIRDTEQCREIINNLDDYCGCYPEHNLNFSFNYSNDELGDGYKGTLPKSSG